MSDEAFKTPEIEGEILNRDSLQSSIQRHFGLKIDHRRVSASEHGVSEMMVDLYKNFETPLTHEILFEWHKMIMNGRRDLTEVGSYRTDSEPMLVVSGAIHAPKIHFEGPPSKVIKQEMNEFIKWFNNTAPSGKYPLSPLIRAGITHLYFICIHPFEDGNGRIARALCEKALSQCLRQPILIALSYLIQDKRKTYYEKLEKSNKNNQIDDWLSYFSKTILEAQKRTLSLVDFLIEKTKFYDQHKNQLNERQLKVIDCIVKEVSTGFEGSLSAKKYIVMTGASRATATRDLQNLVEQKVLIQEGSGKGTRYQLNFCARKK